MANSLRNLAELPEDAILTVEEVAAWLGMEPHRVFAHADGQRTPLLPSLRLSRLRRLRRFLKSDVSRFLDELQQHAE